MIGRSVSHYRIVGQLGAGAMGVVYQAEDVRLGRLVALKVLRPDVAPGTAAHARFLQEARAASALDHPNICTVYESGETDQGEAFLAMAHCAGESLEARLAREPLTIADALDIAAQITEGLAEAHAHAIVHRDIKPANILITQSGRVKIVDFGLALLSEGSAVTTGAGVALGTLAYMSPEQARGEIADGRADLWALGVVLYEMLAGRRPFTGESAAAALYAILNSAPPPLDRLRADLPQGVVAIVNRMLTKDLFRRYQHAEQILADLRACRERLTAGGATMAGAAGRTPSIAVLPFANLSADTEQQYFCDGMTEELITALGGVSGLRVAAATSTFYLKGQALEIRAIGERLNVETLLEGSVRRSGNRLRITAQLVNVSDGYQLWSERYDRQLDDVFAVQDDIARAIVEKLKVKLIGGEDDRLVRRTTNVEAYQVYLQGRYFFARRHKDGLERAVDCFSRAVALDPGFAPAYAGLAEALGAVGFWSTVPPRPVRAKAVQAAARAVALDDSLADTHRATAMVHTWVDWNWEVSEPAFKRAIELDPHASVAHGFYALSLAGMDRVADVEREAAQAMALDPLSALVCFLSACGFYGIRQYARALEIAEQGIALDPGCVPAHWAMIHGLTDTGQSKQAVEAGERAVKLVGRVPFMLGPLGRALALSGYPREARAILEELIERSAREAISPMWMAPIYAGLGDVDGGIAALERGIEDWGPAYAIYVASPACEALSADPRFAEILRRVGYAGPWARPRPGRG